MNKLKLNDEVIVTAGSEKGKKGKLLKINAKTNRVMIEGVKMLKKSVKPTQENPSGGFAEVNGYIHISNISLVSPKTGAASRVRIETKDGKKVRVLTKCNTEL
ncbi:50S ribosomal protein L24 [Bacteriovoracaceae bacterium]|nr:50S ribosomal protein L24 [Bacteriovoracaceae bacterium]